jgi:uncharacterized protein YciI
MRRILVAGLLLASLALAQADTELYYVGFLRPAPKRTLLSREEGEKLQAAHMAHIHKMADDGNLVAAGPFEDEPVTISGIFIMKAASLQEAQRIANQDPTIVAKRNTIDLHPWRGPAGIGQEYSRLHKADPKTPEDMGVHPIVFLRPGPNWSRGVTEALDFPMTGPQVMEGAVRALKQEGKLVAAGPIEGEADFKGLLIFGRIPLAEAKEALEKHLFMPAGVVKPEYHQFYSAAHVFTW